MVPITGLIRVLRDTVRSGREVAEWMDTDEGAAELARAYPANQPASTLDPDDSTK
jgi:hypothetical protein